MDHFQKDESLLPCAGLDAPFIEVQDGVTVRALRSCATCQQLGVSSPHAFRRSHVRQVRLWGAKADHYHVRASRVTKGFRSEFFCGIMNLASKEREGVGGPVEVGMDIRWAWMLG